MKKENPKTKNSIYNPSDDSYLLSDFINDYIKKISEEKKENLTILDMGTGSGVISEAALNAGIERKNILAVDINKQAVEFVKKKGFNAINSDLFDKIPNTKKFDIIIFNAPYLPIDNEAKKHEPLDSRLATTGGEKGDEISLKFLNQIKSQNRLNKDGKIFLLISSLTPIDGIKKFGPKKVHSKKIFFEELKILEFSK